MRFWLLAMVAVVGGPASATYDLMFVGENPVGGQARVWRYDPVARRTLGTFGEGFISGTISSVAVDASRGIAYVQNSVGRISQFDYSTGVLLRALNIGSAWGEISVDPVTGYLLLGNGQGSGWNPSYSLDFSTGGVVATYRDFFHGSAPLRRPGGTHVFSFGLSTSAVTLAASAYPVGGGARAGLVDSGAAWTGANAVRASAFSGTNGTTFYGLANDGATNRLYRVSTSATDFVGSISQPFNVASLSSSVGLVAGHGDLLYLRNGAQIIQFETTTNQVIGTQSLPFGTNSTLAGMAIVVAPEPGTMLALGVGLVALVRRRRSRA